MLLRGFIGFIVAVLIWWGALYFTHLPKDRFLPPGLSMENLSQTTTGYVVKGVESGYSDHWYDGNSGNEWFLIYKFQPTIWAPIPGGGHAPEPQSDWQFGKIPIGEDQYNKISPGSRLEVTYDPWNPMINGVTGTGKINTGASWFSPWLLYVLGFIATAVLIAEVCKKWIIPSGY